MIFCSSFCESTNQKNWKLGTKDKFPKKNIQCWWWSSPWPWRIASRPFEIYEVIINLFLSFLSNNPFDCFCREEVARHNSATDCWIIVNNKVYNGTVTKKNSATQLNTTHFAVFQKKWLHGFHIILEVKKSSRYVFHVYCFCFFFLIFTFIYSKFVFSRPRTTFGS